MCRKAHHVLAEIIQGGLVLETNIDEIESSGLRTCSSGGIIYRNNFFTAQQAARARKDSYASSNPLSLGGGPGAIGSRGSGLPTPLGWLTTKLTGTGVR